MTTDPPCGFSVEDITLGAFPHGFGTTDEGLSFAFRTVRSTLSLEIYRADMDADVPAPRTRSIASPRGWCDWVSTSSR